MTFYISFIISVIFNIIVGCYIVYLLKKFVFISENISDLFLTTKSFKIFVSSMYGMESYHGEPMIQELIGRIKEFEEEIEDFRDIFEHTLDTELEEELNAAQEEEE